MKTNAFIAILVGAFCVASVAFMEQDGSNTDVRGEESHAGMRQVSATILVENTEVFYEGFGDSGHPGPDDVWNYLNRARFKPLKDGTAKLELDGDAITLTGHITVDVDYGGEKTLEELTLRKVTTNEGEHWELPPNFAERWFDARLIPRSYAAEVMYPHVRRKLEKELNK